MAELKPCPFCGGDNVLVIKTDIFNPSWYARCNDCKVMSTFYKTREDAVAGWNQRKQVEPNKGG